MDILLTSIVSLTAAIIGGWIAGKYALRAQKQAAEDQRRRDVEAENRMINSTLQAIGTELTVLKIDFLDRLQQMYDGREDRHEPGFEISRDVIEKLFCRFRKFGVILRARCL